MESDCNDLCRLCREPTGEAKWPIFQPDSEQHLQTVLQMITSCTNLEISDSDQLPHHICGGCYEELHFAYSTWQYYRESQNHPKCPAGEEVCHYQCRICTRDDSEDLISVDCPSLNSDEPVSETFRKFTGFTIQEGDGLAPYFCDSCLAQLERAAKFTQRCQWAEGVFEQENVHPWETMEFKVEESSMLVDEPQAMLVLDPQNPQVAKCSVCQHEKPPGEYWSACEGCLLEFSNADEWQNNVEQLADSRPDSAVDDCDGGAGSELNMMIEELYDEDEVEEEAEQPIKKKVKGVEQARLPNKKTKQSISLKKEFGEEVVIEKEEQQIKKKVKQTKSTLLFNKNTNQNVSLKKEYDEEDLKESEELPKKKKKVKIFLFSNKSTKRNISLEEQYDEEDVEEEDEDEQPVRKKAKGPKPTRLPNKDITKFLERHSMAFSDAFQTLQDFPLYAMVQRKIPMCCSCNCFYLTQEAFASHRALNHLRPEEPGPYMCEVCFTSFKLRKHYTYHRNKFEVGVYGYCKLCDRILISKEDTDTHVMISHPTEWEALEASNGCGVDTSLISKSHENPSDDEDVPYEYEALDSLTIVPKKGLQAFLQTVSMGIEEIFQIIPAGSCESYSRMCSRQNFCCGCKLFFITKQVLRDHTLEVHSSTPSSNKKFQCQICYRSFLTQDELNEHAKPKLFFYCKICDLIFLIDSDFFGHRLATHMTDRDKEPLKHLFSKAIARSGEKLANNKTTPPVYILRCKVAGCSYKTLHEDNIMKHCLMHRQQQIEKGKSDQNAVEPQQLEGAEGGVFDAMNLLNRKTRKDLVPLEGGIFEGLESLTVIPFIRFESFLQKTSLRMEDLFDVLADNQHSVRIRRKTPLCCVCNILFYTEQALADHKAKEHPRPEALGPETCEQCNTTFKSKKLYQVHVTWKSIENCLYNYCRLCDQIQTHGRHTSHMYRKHMTKENQKRFESLYSSVAIFGCSRADSTAVSTTDCGEADDFKCIKCGGFFECNEDLTRHKGRKKWFKYSCRIGECPFKAYSEEDIIEHCLMVSHVDAMSNFSSHVTKAELGQLFDVIPAGEDLPYCKLQLKAHMCCGCNTFHSTKSVLTKHCKAAHRLPTGDGKWSCDVCRHTFGTAENKLRHEAKRKTGTFDYCHSCQLVMESGSFYRHQAKEHPEANAPGFLERQFCVASEIRFKCCVSQCGNQFDSDANLLQHMNAFHEISEHQDNTSCEYCGADFETIEEYYEHSNRQFELIRYCCLTAGCDFSTRSREDMLRHASEESYGTGVVSKVEKPVGTVGDVPSEMVRDGTVHGFIDIFKQPGEVCCGCQAFLVSREELLRHKAEFHATINDDFQFRCDTCNKGFLYRSFLDNHQNNVPTRRRYQCRVCKITLLDMEQVNHHVSYIHGDSDEARDLSLLYDAIAFEQLPCCGCDQQYPTMEQLAAHCLDSHPEPPKPTKRRQTESCEHCHQHFFNQENYLSHIVGYGNRLIFKCKIKKCPKQTTSLQEIEHHVSAVPHEPRKQEDPPEFTCCVKPCEFRSESYEAIIEHSVCEHSKQRQANNKKYSRDNYPCPACCLKFNDEARLLNHRNGSGSKQCVICRNTYTPAKMAAHVVRCRQKFKISCETCAIEFRLKLDYIAHMRAEHGWKRTDKKKKELREICNICGATVAQYSMANHLASHENKREFKCPLCPQRFNTAQLLKLHNKRVHIGGQLFACRMGCSNEYKNGVDRNRHEKLVHTGDLPFKCELCAKAFVRDRDLRIHMQQHTGRRLYTCPRCPKEFDKKKDLVEHEGLCGETENGVDYCSDDMPE